MPSLIDPIGIICSSPKFSNSHGGHTGMTQQIYSVEKLTRNFPNHYPKISQ